MSRFSTLCSCGAQTILDDGRHCTACHRAQATDGFYPHPTSPDGLRSICKECHNDRAITYREGNQDRLRVATERRRVTDPEKARRQNNSWKERDPDRWRIVHRAGQAVLRAIKRGDLVRPVSCSACGRSGPVEASHHDYSKPLDVRWLCRSCHKRSDALNPKAPMQVGSGVCHVD